MRGSRWWLPGASVTLAVASAAMLLLLAAGCLAPANESDGRCTEAIAWHSDQAAYAAGRNESLRQWHKMKAEQYSSAMYSGGDCTDWLAYRGVP